MIRQKIEAIHVLNTLPLHTSDGTERVVVIVTSIVGIFSIGVCGNA